VIDTGFSKAATLALSKANWCRERGKVK
jgi:hypothetical protein